MFRILASCIRVLQQQQQVIAAMDPVCRELAFSFSKNGCNIDIHWFVHELDFLQYDCWFHVCLHQNWPCSAQYFLPRLRRHDKQRASQPLIFLGHFSEILKTSSSSIGQLQWNMIFPFSCCLRSIRQQLKACRYVGAVPKVWACSWLRCKTVCVWVSLAHH